MKKTKILSILSIITLLTSIIFPILSSKVYAGVVDVTGGSGVNVDTTVVEHYTDVNITDDITLEKDKEFIIDFTKTDNLSKGLSYLADVGNTVYYKVVDNKLKFTENESEAVIKIVRNESENKAVMTLINTNDNKSYNLDFSCRRLDRSTLTYNGTEEDASGSATIKQTRDNYYTRYNFKCKLNLIVNATQDSSNTPKTITWDSDKTNNPNIKDNELLKNGTIELGGEEIDSGSVVLSVNDVTLTKEQISNFEEKANGYEISSYLNINLDQVIYKGTATDVWTNELKELNNEATITLRLEEGVNGNEVVIVHEKHDGTYEIIPTTYNPETNTITFKTSSFSNYAIASKTIDTISTNPQTGDNIIMFIIIFALALTGILVTFIINKKRVKNNK